jgi:predicted DNA-binding transcriptional regulator AlpA
MDPSKVTLVPPEAIPTLRGELAHLDTLLLVRLLGGSNSKTEAVQSGDRLLGVKEAAAKLGKSPGTLYKTAGKYPFTVRDGRTLRFSEEGIEKFIRQRTRR